MIGLGALIFMLFGVLALIVAAPVPPALEEQVRAAVAPLGPGPFAVRSSAVGEDGSSASFAGQYETVLGVGLDELPNAVRRVLASA